MRIAYVTPYQGPTLIERRPVVRNRSMSNRVKIELIAQLLCAKGHDVEVFSHGEVDRPGLRFYPAFEEPERFHPEIPVRYISARWIRGLYGMSAGFEMKRLLNERHRVSPFDVLIMFNLKAPQIASKRFAEQRGIPVILEYEDDAFRDGPGEVENRFLTVRNYHKRTFRQVLSSVSACVAVSPFLLSQVPRTVPQLLLRGVVGEDVIKASERFRQKKNIVLFSGTHNKINGAEELITAWRAADLSGWELHITGYGDLTDSLRKMTEDCPAIVFHGLVSRADLVELMGAARVCISPEQLSPKPGERFPFKVIEYLAAGAHVVMTAMGNLEREIEEGITYMADNKPETIVSTLRRVIGEERYTRTAERIVQMRYGPNAVSESLDGLLTEVAGRRGSGVAGSSAYREA